VVVVVVVVVVVRRWRVCGADQTETRSVPAIRTLVRTQDAAALPRMQELGRYSRLYGTRKP